MTASTSRRRSRGPRRAGAPDIPGAAEVGLPGWDAIAGFGLFTTAKTPRPVVTKLDQAVVEFLERPEVNEAILKQGTEVAPMKPEELGAFVKSELARWTPIIKATGMKAD